MKFRVQGNSIRFRLNRREVAEFAASGRVSESVQFGGGVTLAYTLAKSTFVESLEASFDGAEIQLRVPQAMADNWAAGESVSMTGSQPLPSGGNLQIAVEKDFQCLHKGEEGKDPDAYPNPATGG